MKNDCFINLINFFILYFLFLVKCNYNLNINFLCSSEVETRNYKLRYLVSFDVNPLDVHKELVIQNSFNIIYLPETNINSSDNSFNITKNMDDNNFMKDNNNI